MLQLAGTMWIATFVALLSAASLSAAADVTPPEITAQGFDIAERQEGVRGQFPRLRVRFEVPGRIAELHVRERSYEVDLATTPEGDHLPLFGLRRQVRQLTDVTLNFQPYINAKLDEVGVYEFQLTVVDRRGESASAALLVAVDDRQVTAREGADRLDTASFRAVRIGGAPVAGAAELGFGWKTVESNRVVIRLAPEAPDGYFFPLVADDFSKLTTQSQLRAAARRAEPQETLELAAAANEGAGRVFGVVRAEKPVMLRIERSHTSLSEIGTTVTLEGEYKF